MNIQLKIGDIVLVNHLSQKGLRGFYSKAIKYFTGSNWTHTAVAAGLIGNTQVLLEADTHVLIDPAKLTFDDSSYQVAVYRHKFLTPEQQTVVIDELFNELNDNTYGYLQVVYFLRRWFWTRTSVMKYMGWVLDLLHKSRDPRGWNNWFIGGTICSEVDWWALYKQEKAYANQELHSWLAQWNSNNFSPLDTEQTVTKFSNLYELIYSK